MAEKQARTNARTWRKNAVQIVEVHRSANGATRANMVATVAAKQVPAVLRAIQASLPKEARLYAIGPEAGSARTVREALQEAARRWSAGDPTGCVRGQAEAATTPARGRKNARLSLGAGGAE
jgi:hypothetical protein